MAGWLRGLAVWLSSWGVGTVTAGAGAGAGLVGGGVLDGGWWGEYFVGTEWHGSPAFERRDVRIDFDWGTMQRPGGSLSPGFRELGVDGYSVRWTGRVGARFSETYTILVRTDDEARLFFRRGEDGEWERLELRRVGESEWSVEVALEEGAVYGIRLEYVERSGPAWVSLRWRGRSTPEEVVEVASQAALNVETYADEIWANAMDGARDEWRDPGFSEDRGRWPGRDGAGWPLGDAGIIVWEGAEPGSVRGRYGLSFLGRARVAAAGAAAEFHVDGVSVGSSLPFGAGWDEVSNRTRVTVEIAPVDLLRLSFTGTRRGREDVTETGVAEVRLMKPMVAGGEESHEDGERFDRRVRGALGRYQALRWISNFETERVWGDRVLPGYSTHRDVGTRRHWELMVLLANETGKDLYVCVPQGADDAYVRSVARLVRYGSDGEQAYEGRVADPVFPPLNPNLRVYVERGNELWNWSFAQAPANAAQGQAEVRDRTANGAILNFDGTNASGDQFYRWHALRSLQMSEVFRGIWGDEAMGSRVRFLLEYQYDNDQNTAASAFDFVDRYFNNADGERHVEEPHPVNHYFWGGGAAVYYSSGNAQGVELELEPAIGNGGGEVPELAGGQAVEAPEGGGWVFSGTSGLYRRADTRDLWTVTVAGAVTNGWSGAGRRVLGCEMTPLVEPLVVYELGRGVVGDRVGYHELRIVRVADRVTVAQAEIPAGAPIEGGYARVRLRVPALLEVGVAYYVVSSEAAGGEAWRASGTRLAVADGRVSVTGAVVGILGNPEWDSGTWQFVREGEEGGTYGPLLVGVASPVGEVGYPPDPPEGGQAFWLAGTGSVSRVVHFARPGVYALRFQAAAKVGLETGVRFHVNDQNATPVGSSHRGASEDHWVPGTGFARDYRQFENNGSFVFTVTNAGPQTLRIASTGYPRYYNPFDVRVDPARQVYFDALECVSVDAIFAGGVPGNGEANGQTGSNQTTFEARVRSQARYAQAYGLGVVAYEGGWSMGGDFGAVPIQNWAKFRDERAAGTAVESMDQFARSGGAVYTWGTYTTWPRGESERSGAFPLARGVDEHGSRLAPEPTHGERVPGSLSVRSSTWSLGLNAGTGGLERVGAWVGWNMISAVTAEYEVRPVVAGSGQVRLWLDGRPVGELVEVSANVTISMRLTRGLHHLRLQAVSGAPVVAEVRVELPGAPERPTGVTVMDEDGAVRVRWEAGASGAAATGYVVRYGTEAGYPTRVVELVGEGVREVRLGGLENGTRHYVTVAARNGVGIGPAAEEVATIPFGMGERVPLVVHEFEGNLGTEAEVAARALSGRVRGGRIRRGNGLLPSTYAQVARNTFGSVAANNFYGTDFAAARQARQYYEFEVEPAEGYRLRLERLRFRPYFQNATGMSTDPRGAGVTYSTNGVDFVAVPVAGVASYFGTTEFTLDLGETAALGVVTGRVVVRIYLFGNGPYEFTGLGGPGDDVVVEGALLGLGDEAPSLRARMERGGLRLELTGLTAGRVHRVQRSEDLIGWELVVGAEGAGATAEYTLPMGAEDGGRYYRVWVPRGVEGGETGGKTSEDAE